jgi:hypothetical protein
LLSWVWTAHTIEVDNRFEAAGAERVGRHFRISLPMWTNGLRCIVEDGITVDELQARTRAVCNLGGLERWGWITVGDGGARRRDGFGTQRGIRGDTIVRPTRAGIYARKLWPRELADVEDRWRSRFGGETIDALRAALLRVVRPMPWSPPEVNPSDGFYTRVLDGDDEEEAEGPLAALLGRVLTSLTVEHEQRAKASLPLGANFLRVIDAHVVRLRDLPALAGISKEGVAMGTGYLLRSGLASSEPERTIRLSASGLDALGSYRDLAAGAEDATFRDELAAVVTQKDALAAGLVPPEGCWRGEHPYLAQTKRLLADPTGSLPWQPMVLHRGGWPDAS